MCDRNYTKEGLVMMYNFTDAQCFTLETLKAVKNAVNSQPPASDTRTLLLETYDKIFDQLATDIGSSIIKPKLQKDIT